jgi:hypothetical protein
MDEAEGQLALGQLSGARQLLAQAEGDLRTYRAQNGGQGGDFDPRYQVLKRQLECQEHPEALKGGEALNEAASRQSVTAAILAKDAAQLARFIDCGADWALPNSEPERLTPPEQFAKRLLEFVAKNPGQKPELTFRKSPGGRWKLVRALIGAGH